MQKENKTGCLLDKTDTLVNKMRPLFVNKKISVLDKRSILFDKKGFV